MGRATTLAALGATLLAVSTLDAQQPARPADRPVAAPANATDLSGSWVLNKAKSDFGMLPVPVSDTANYTRAGNVYRVLESSASDTGQIHVAYSWPIGAGEVVSDIPDAEATIQTRVTMHGDTALFVSQLKHKGQAIEIQSGREYLSPDGKTRTREFDLQSLANPDEDTQHLLAVFERLAKN